MDGHPAGGSCFMVRPQGAVLFSARNQGTEVVQILRPKMWMPLVGISLVLDGVDGFCQVSHLTDQRESPCHRTSLF